MSFHTIDLRTALLNALSDGGSTPSYIEPLMDLVAERAGADKQTVRTALYKLINDGSARSLSDDRVVIATPPGFQRYEPGKRFADSLQGAIAMLRHESTYNTEGATGIADPQVEGVWRVGLADGVSVICYLAGYRDPYGRTRNANDFESNE